MPEPTIVESYTLQTPADLRTWRIEIFSDGRILATDIMSPTGQTEWLHPDQLRGLPDPRRSYDWVDPDRHRRS